MIELSPLEYPTDRVFGEVTFGDGTLTSLPVEEIQYFQHLMRDQSLDEAEETLREEREYWHGISVVGPEWFFD